MISLEDLIANNRPVSIQNPHNHLLIKNYQYQYPIKTQTTMNEDRVDFVFKPITKYYRTAENWQSLAETISFTINLSLYNFCLYPGEQLERLINFRSELQHYHGRN